MMTAIAPEFRNFLYEVINSSFCTVIIPVGSGISFCSMVMEFSIMQRQTEFEGRLRIVGVLCGKKEKTIIKLIDKYGQSLNWREFSTLVTPLEDCVLNPCIDPSVSLNLQNLDPNYERKCLPFLSEGCVLAIL